MDLVNSIGTRREDKHLKFEVRQELELTITKKVSWLVIALVIWYNKYTV